MPNVLIKRPYQLIFGEEQDAGSVYARLAEAGVVRFDGTVDAEALTVGGSPVGGGGAPADSQYIVLASDAEIENARRLVAGTGVTLVDGGAGGDLTASVDIDAALEAMVHDASIAWLVEDFPHNNVATGAIGTHGWRTYNIAGTTVFTYIDGADTGRMGVLNIASGSAADNQGGGITLNGGGGAERLLPRMDQLAGWEARFNFRLVSVADVGVMLGFTRAVADPPTTGFLMRFDTDQSDTEFMCLNGAGAAASLGVAVDTAWHMLRIRSLVAGTIRYSMDGGTEVLKTDGGITATEMPFMQVQTRVNGTAKSIQLDRFSFSWRGLTR